MKKLFSALLVFSVIVSLSCTAFAVEANQEESLVGNEIPEVLVQESNMSEFDMAKALDAFPDEVLSGNGYSEEEIAQIRDYPEVFSEQIQDLNDLSDETLSSFGYTDDQIEIIRDFDGSEQQMARVAAQVKIQAWGSLSYDGTYTRGTLNYLWNWTGIPAYKMKDALVVSWNGWFVESNTSYVSYNSVYDDSYYTQTSATFTTENTGTAGAGHTFAVAKNDNNYYAKNGGGSFTVRSDTQCKKDMGYYIAYGHTQIVPTVSISFVISTGGADGSISFEQVSTIAGEKKGGYIRCP